MATKKTAGKAKTNKTAIKNSVKSATVSRQTNSRLNVRITALKRWNIIIAVLLAAQALAIFIIGKAVTLPVVTHYLAKDTLASQAIGHTVLAPAVRQLFFIDIRY